MSGEDLQSIPLLRTRLEPSAPSDSCPHERLLQRMGQASAGLRVVQAPAGFGKTQLLRQWRERQRDAGVATAWLTLQPQDTTADVLAYLAFALQEAAVIAGGGRGRARADTAAARSVPALLQAIESREAPGTLILDDADGLPEAVQKAVIEPLLRLRPARLEVCIACRAPLPLPLSRYLIDGSLQLIDAAALQFSRRELHDWLAERIERRELESLIDQAEGWPAAVQLLLGNPSTRQGKVLTVPVTQALDGDAGCYFREQVLSGLSDSARTFLLETSPLERVDAASAAFIRSEATHPRLWAELAERLAALWTPDGPADGRRLHGLLRRHLRRELAVHAPERYAELNRQAARWMAEHGRPLDGIRHALEAGEPEHAARIFEDLGAARLWLHEGMDRIHRILAMLEPHALASFPRIQVARSLAHAKNGHMEKARASLREASRVSRHFRQDRSGGNDLELLVDGYFIELLLTEYGCAPQPAALRGPLWEQVLGFAKQDPALLGYVQTFRCLWHTQTGRFPEAFEHGKEAIEIFRRGNSSYGELFIHLHLGMTEIGRGRIGAALEEHQQALRIVRAGFPKDRGVRRICNIALGEAYWELGDDAGARRFLRNVTRHLKQPEAWFDLYMAAYQTSIEFLFAESGAGSAEDFQREASEHASRQGLARLQRFIGATFFLCLSRAGREEDARAAGKRSGAALLPDRGEVDALTWREAEVLALAASEAARIAGDLAGAREALAWGAGFARERDITRMTIHCLIQGACLDQAAGNGALAQEQLREALALAAGNRYARPFLREARRLAPVAAALADVREDDAEHRLLQRLRSATASGRHGDSGLAPLSAREREVLAALAHGQPDKLIARSLGLSPHGVRYHLKKLYSRLGVQNRTQAVSRARQQGLLPGTAPNSLI